MSDNVYFTLVLLLLAGLLLGIFWIRRRFGWAWASAAMVGSIVIFAVASSISMCACGSDQPLRQGRVRATLDHIRLAEEARFNDGGRYVPLDSLDYGDTYATRATLTILSDSSYRVDGVSLDDSTVTCTYTTVRTRHPDPTIHCPRP